MPDHAENLTAHSKPMTAATSTAADDAAGRLADLWRQGVQPRVEDFIAQAGSLPPEQICCVLQVDQSERFRWGEPVPAEEYLQAFPAVADDSALALDLIFGEYVLRESAGGEPALEEFLARFPRHAEELKLQIELHRAIEKHDLAPVSRAGTYASMLLDARWGETAKDGEGLPSIHGYEVLGVLGRGGMGIVYRAWHRDLSRPVALKMLYAGAQATAAVLARFRVEAEAVARLQHPNIVAIYDLGHHAGAPYLVLELVEGTDLAQRMAGTPQPAKWSAELVGTLARAVHTAHQSGVVHRDLTPSNILLSAHGVPKITDFGLAKLLFGVGEPRTRTGDLLGTPSYMAPEQAAMRGQAIGSAADIYSLGAILYELLTGRPPFKGESPLETLRQTIDDPPVPPSRLNPKLARDLETICLKCLDKEPSRRFSSALDLADDLQRFLEGRPISARASSRSSQVWRWCRRNPGLAATSTTLTAAILCLVLGAVLSSWLYRGQRDQIAHDLVLMKLSEWRERRARKDARAQLFGALVDRARAQRKSRQAGQRFDSLEALRQAVAIARELELPAARLDPLRDEAIAALALPDLQATARKINRPSNAFIVAFDPSMTRYARRFRDGTIEVRKTADDQEIARFHARGDREIFVLAFSPDARYLATTHFPGGGLIVWDVESGATVVDDPGLVTGHSARFSPDGRHIAVARLGGEVRLYELATGRVAREHHLPRRTSINDLAFHPDGSLIAATSAAPDPTCWIIESLTGRLVRTIPLPARAELAWSPDGTMLATLGMDRQIAVWDPATGGRRAAFDGRHNGGLRAGFHPFGPLLATNGWDSHLRLWDPILGQPWFSVAGGSFVDCEFSRGGRIALALGGELTIYEVDPAVEYQTLAHASHEKGDYFRAAIRGDGRVLAMCGERGVVLWDLARARQLAFLPIGTAIISRFEPSGDLLTSGANGVERWPVRLALSQNEFRIGPPERLPLPGDSAGIAQDARGRVLALARYSSCHVLAPHGSFDAELLDDARYVALSPDGEWLAAGSHGNSGASVWRVRDGARVANFAGGERTNVEFSSDCRWLLTGSLPCRLWSVGDWQLAWELDGVGQAFSPDGRLVLVALPSKSLALVEAATGRRLARFEAPGEGSVWSAIFSPDGSRLVVLEHDTPAIRVWNLRAIRRRLGELGLDWNAPAFSEDDPSAREAPPLPEPRVDPGPFAADAEHFTEAPQTLLERYTLQLQKNPEDGDAAHHRAHALLQLGRRDEAIADFTTALRFRPDDPHLRYSRARSLWSPGREDLAIADLEIALAHDKESGALRQLLADHCNERAWDLAEARRTAQDLEKALTFARRAVDLSPGRASYLNTLGVVQFRAGHYAEAVATLKRSLEAGCGQADAFDLFFLAQAHHALGQTALARLAFDRAVRWVGEHQYLKPEFQSDLAGFRAESLARLGNSSAK